MVEKNPRFESVEELIDYVEKEAESRVKEILNKYGRLGETEAYDNVVVKLLRDLK